MVANYPFLSNIFAHIADKSICTVIITHDVMMQRFESFKKAGLCFDGTAEMVEREHIDLQRAEVLLAIQQEDAALLREMVPSADVILMPISASIKRSAVQQVAGRCLFVGSSTDHNVTGLNWFFSEVWEKVLAGWPQCQLHVCGNIAGNYNGLSYPNVTFRGIVDDIDAEYGEAEVCVAPILAGSGLKIKVVEAMAHRRAMVTTAIGVQGISQANNTAIFVADSPDDFARSIAVLLADSARRTAMEAQAEQYVVAHFSPSSCYQPFVDRITRRNKVQKDGSAA